MTRASFPDAVDSIEAGVATHDLRALLRRWVEIDWMAPPREGGEAQAVAAFARHISTARRIDASVPWPTSVELARGTRGDFDDLCRRVRQGFDWRNGVLKQLAHRHATSLGQAWDEAPPHAEAFVQTLPGGRFLWRGRWQPNFTPPLRETENFYIGYAGWDLDFGIAMQLREPSRRLVTNPFAALVECYANGHYPFALERERTVLFAFDRA